MNKNDESICRLSKLPPKTPGFYWFFDEGEHTPAMLEVERDGKMLMASNEEFMFDVSKKPVDGEYWGKIPMPYLNGKIIKPGSY